MLDQQEEFVDWLGLEFHEYVSELRLSLDPVQEFKQDLKAYRKACHLEKSELKDLKAHFLDIISSFDETWTEQLDRADRWAELEPEYEAPYKRFAQDLWYSNKPQRETVFFTEESLGNSHELYMRESTTSPVTRVLMTAIGNFDLDLTEKVHSAWLRVNPVVIGGRPKLKVGMLLVDLGNGRVDCNVFRCKQHMNLVQGDREFAEYQLLQMFAHLGSHEHPENPWPKFAVDVSALRYEDSDDQRLLNRQVTLNNQRRSTEKFNYVPSDCTCEQCIE